MVLSFGIEDSSSFSKGQSYLFGDDASGETLSIINAANGTIEVQSDAALELIGTNMRLENEGAIRVVGRSSGSEFLVTNGASLLQRSSGSIYLDDSSAVFAVGTSAFILEESIVSGTGSIVGSGTVVVRERGHLNVASGLLFVSDLRSGSPRSVAIVAQKGAPFPSQESLPAVLSFRTFP